MKPSIQIPLLFVFLWSSCYVAFEVCAAHIEPATFVVVRASITALIVFCVLCFTKPVWPKRWVEFLPSAIVGILMHGAYGGGSFASIYHGMDITLCALILSLQPILTVLISNAFLGEKITARKFLGIFAGFVGVSIIILQGATGTDHMRAESSSSGEETSLLATSLCFMALFAISIATIVQKRYCSKIRLMPGACIQYTSAAVFMLPIALTFETMQISWNLGFVLGLGWLVVFVSIGAMTLLMMLIQRGDAGTVSNLFYLVTPFVAVEAWIIFDEKLTPTAIAGTLITIVGVMIVNFSPTVPAPLATHRSVARSKFRGRLQDIEPAKAALMEQNAWSILANHRNRSVLPSRGFSSV